MTTRYNDWLTAVSGGTFDVTKVNLNIKLVAEDYVPDEAHKPADVDKYIINGVSAIVNDYFCMNSMSNILDTIKAKMELGFQTFPYEIGLEIERVFFGEPEKAEKLKQLVQMRGDNNYQLWHDLKENGIKYFVAESTVHGVLCFCEEI
mgnify:CR=1 FL=1